MKLFIRVTTTLGLLLFVWGCSQSYKANNSSPYDNNPFFKNPQVRAAGFERNEFFAAMTWLDGFYKEPDGLMRPNGLSLNGRPDFEGIAAWIFDVYLAARWSGDTPDSAKQQVISSIQHTDEWAQKHPGKPPLKVPVIRTGSNQNRPEFLDIMNRLDRYYAAPEGLMRPQGLSIGGKPDFEGIATWIFDIYLNSRQQRNSVEDSWNRVVQAIEVSDEWRAKHPGVGPREGCFPLLLHRQGEPAILAAAELVRSQHPEFFVANASREVGYKMMTRMINILRHNGVEVVRALSNSRLPPTDFYRWGSDALALRAGNGWKIYDVYDGWPYPAKPHILDHGLGEAEATADLIQMGGCQ